VEEMEEDNNSNVCARTNNVEKCKGEKNIIIKVMYVIV
jgi:hypothetical protein